MGEPWVRSGLVKSAGIPRPSGGRSVGCVDLMHQFEGDDNGGLLVRLFYPAQLNSSQPQSQPSAYAAWAPNKRYIKAYTEFQKKSGFLSSLLNAILSPRMPAVLGTALLVSPESPVDAPGNSAGVNTSETESSKKEVNPESGESSERVNNGDTPPFSVIVFSHGLGGMRTTYSAICCDLASHGYVVAAVEHRDRSACACLQRVLSPGSSPETPRFQDKWIEFYHKLDSEKEFPLRNKQVRRRSREAIMALELLTKLNEGIDVNNMMEGNFNFKQFQGRLDIRKAAIMGHSFGGATTIQTLSEDERFLCGIALDCWMIPIHRDLLETGVNQPLLFINSFDFQWPDNVRKMMKLTYPPQHIGASACTILTLKGTGHADQSDMSFVLPKLTQRWTRQASSLDPALAHKLNMDICHSFLKRYQLRDPAFLGQKIPNLDGGEGQSEHILFGSNVDVSVPSDDKPTSLTTGVAGEERGSSSLNVTQAHSEDNKAMREGGRDASDELVGEFTEGKKEADPPTDSGQAAKL